MIEEKVSWEGDGEKVWEGVMEEEDLVGVGV